MDNSARPHAPNKIISRIYPKLGLWISAVGLSMIGALWLVALELVQQDHADEVRSIVKVQSNIAKAMETHVLDILDDADNMLLFMKRSYESQSIISANAREMLESTNVSRFTSQAGILNPNGNFIFSFRPAIPGVNLVDRPYFQAHIRQDTGTRFIGSTLIGRVSGQSSFHMSRRINKADGTFGGVVAMAIGTDFFAETFKRTTLEKMHFMLVGLDGYVRAVDVDSAELMGKDLTGGFLFRAMNTAPQSGDYLAEVMYLDIRRFVSYRVIKGYPLVVAVSVDESIALGRFYERQNIYYGTAILISVILIIMMVVLRHMLRRQELLDLTILAEKERAEHYLEMAGSMIVALDLEGRVTLLNRRGSEILGYEASELLGKDWFSTIIPPENRDYVRAKFQQVLYDDNTGSQHLADMEVLTRDGGRRMISWMNNLLRDTQGKLIGVLSSGSDVTERRELEAELMRLATTDPLTGLSNRRSFLETGRREFDVFERYNRPLSLLMLDIDCFKQVNDFYGHAAGDQVLVRLAEICRKVLRSVELCGRFGGEEFICLLLETPAEKAVIVAERLRQALAEQVIATKNGEISITVSIGVSTAKSDDASIEDLIHRADSAMYIAKQAGRNRVVAG